MELGPLDDYLKASQSPPRDFPRFLIEADPGPSLFGRLVRYLGRFCPEFSLDYDPGKNYDPACEVFLGELRPWFHGKDIDSGRVRAYFSTAPQALDLFLKAGPSFSAWGRGLPENPTFWSRDKKPAFLISTGKTGTEAILDSGSLDPDQSRILGFLKLLGLRCRPLEGK